MGDSPGYEEASRFSDPVLVAILALAVTILAVVTYRFFKKRQYFLLLVLPLLGWSVLASLSPVRVAFQHATLQCASPASGSFVHGVPNDASMNTAMRACRGRSRITLTGIVAAEATSVIVVLLAFRRHRVE